jgi:hypothetical protein
MVESSCIDWELIYHSIWDQITIYHNPDIGWQVHKPEGEDASAFPSNLSELAYHPSNLVVSVRISKSR